MISSFKKTSHSLQLLFMGVLLLSGCGYTQKSALPEGVKTIYVEPVRNKIELSELYAYVPGLEAMINNALTERFNKDGNLRVVNDRTKADVILAADLFRFEQGGVRFTTLESVQEYRLFVVVSAKLTNAKTKEVIWEEPNFSGDADYYVSDIRSLARQEAAERAVKRLAASLVDRVVGDW